jgi:hypothetical protein
MNKMPDEYDAEEFGSKQHMDNWQALGVTIEDVAEFCDGNIEDKVGEAFSKASLLVNPWFSWLLSVL